MKFETNRKLLQTLLEGKLFRTQGGGKLYFQEDNPKMFVYEGEGVWIQMDSSWKNEELTEIKEWYEDIPEQGVLCWVSDTTPNKKDTIVVITSYREGRDYPFKDETCWWEYATPTTKEEIDKYLLKE